MLRNKYFVNKTLSQVNKKTSDTLFCSVLYESRIILFV